MSGPGNYRRRPGRGRVNSSGLVSSQDLPVIRVRRTVGQLSLGGDLGANKEVLPARVILNDLTVNGVLIFTTRSLTGNQSVALTITEPRKFYVKGRVIACQEVPINPGIVTEHSFMYRVELRFELASDAEKKAVQEYCSFISDQFLADAA